MPKMIVGKKVVYLEIYEIDTDKLSSARDDLDLCERILYSADSAFSQKLKSFTEEGKSAVRLLCRLQENIIKNPVFPVTRYEEGRDEAPRVPDKN